MQVVVQVHAGLGAGGAVLDRQHDGPVLAVLVEPGGAAPREGVVARVGGGRARVAQVVSVPRRVGGHTESMA